MLPELDSLLRELEPHAEANLDQRLRFGLACAQRVSHLLERPEVEACVRAFEAILSEPGKRAELSTLVEQATWLANSHQGSKSLDGVGHAAVSATYACAKAIEGKARQAAEYAAYAMVYGGGGYGATSDLSAFEPEYRWQATQLRAVLGRDRRAASEA